MRRHRAYNVNGSSGGTRSCCRTKGHNALKSARVRRRQANGPILCRTCGGLGWIFERVRVKRRKANGCMAFGRRTVTVACPDCCYRSTV